MTKNQSGERHDGIFLLQSPFSHLTGWMWHSSSCKTGGQEDLETRILESNKYLQYTIYLQFLKWYLQPCLPPRLNHTAQPEKWNQKLCGVESSPFCLFAVGFLSTTPTCHSHGVTSRSCLFWRKVWAKKVEYLFWSEIQKHRSEQFM